MKNLSKLILLLIPTMALVACGSGGTSSEGTSSSAGSSSSSASSTSSSEDYIKRITYTDGNASYETGDIYNDLCDPYVYAFYNIMGKTLISSGYTLEGQDSEGASFDIGTPFVLAGTYSIIATYEGIVSAPFEITVAEHIETSLLVYSNEQEVTSGKVPSSKVTHDGYYQPTYATDNLWEVNTIDQEYRVPSTGKSNILVVPVDFTNFPAKGNLGTEHSSQQFIYKNFFGNSTDTGWESLRSYYDKSSYGALRLQGAVTEWYHAPYTTSKFAKLTDSKSTPYSAYFEPTWKLLDEVVEFVKTTYPDLDLTQYDNDNNGYLDGVWMVYSCSYNKSDTSTYWAYTYFNYDNLYEDVTEDDPIGFNYCWASYAFMSQGLYKDSEGNVLADAHTFIHETGHLLGLDDYYDYQSSSSPAGSIDMMDYNVGDHNAFSKMLLDWTTPYVIDGTKDTVEITIEDFEESGDCILLRNTVEDPWNGSPYDEYFLFELYNQSGLNEQDSKNGYASSGVANGFYKTPGIKMWHVDARMMIEHDHYNSKTDEWEFVDFTYGDKVPTDTAVDSYYVLTTSNTSNRAYICPSESSSIKTGSSYRFLQAIEGCGSNVLGTSKYADHVGQSDKVLFQQGESFNLADFASFFTNKTTDEAASPLMNDYSDLGWKVDITSIADDGANATLTFTKI